MGFFENLFGKIEEKTAVPIPEIIKPLFEQTPDEDGNLHYPSHVNIITGAQFFEDGEENQS